jgi:hypothetical protein
MDLQNVLLQISIWSVLLPLLVGVVFYRKLDRDSTLIFSLVFIASVPQLLSFLPISLHAINASYNIYTPVEFVVLYLLFSNKFTGSIYIQVLKVSGIIYVIVCLLFLFYYGISQKFINELVCVNNLIYLLWMLLYIRKQFFQPDDDYSLQKPFFWYFTGLIIYAPCTMVVFALYYYLRQNSDYNLQNLWIIQSFCNTLMYVLFAIGLGKTRAPSKVNTTR